MVSLCVDVALIVTSQKNEHYVEVNGATSSESPTDKLHRKARTADGPEESPGGEAETGGTVE